MKSFKNKVEKFNFDSPYFNLTNLWPDRYFTAFDPVTNAIRIYDHFTLQLLHILSIANCTVTDLKWNHDQTVLIFENERHHFYIIKKITGS